MAFRGVYDVDFQLRSNVLILFALQSGAGRRKRQELVELLDLNVRIDFTVVWAL